jgi:protein-disulfide isomerase
LKRFHLLAAFLAIFLAVGCKAQPASPTDTTLNRRIEVLVRSQYSVPEDYAVVLGARTPSQIPGYDALPVTLSRSGKATIIQFLLSTDNKTLARLEKFDLVNDSLFSIDVANRPIRGNPAAKVTVISFDDLECPFCARMHETLFPATLDHYKDKVRMIYKDNPLVEIHPWAMRAAVDSDCLAAQSNDVYWKFVDYIHGHGQEVTGDNRNIAKSFDTLDRIAREQATLGKLDPARLDSCLAQQDESKVRASMKEAVDLRIEGAPALFVDGEFISGAVPQAQVWMVIDRALRAAGVEPPPEPVSAATPPAAQSAPASATK